MMSITLRRSALNCESRSASQRSPFSTCSFAAVEGLPITSTGHVVHTATKQLSPMALAFRNLVVDQS